MMDSSPRPLRRFSRWQTTKRKFVLGGVSYNPPDEKTSAQEKEEKPESFKHKLSNTKNDKSTKKNALNHSREVQHAKQTSESEKFVIPTKPSYVRILRLDTSREHGGETHSTDEAAQDQDAQQASVREPAANDAATNNKSALCSISQNTSAEDGVMQDCPSPTAGSADLHSSTQITTEPDLITSTVVRHNRGNLDGEESSDSVSTDKENKDKDSDRNAGPSPAKKSRHDGPSRQSSQSMSTSTVDTATAVNDSKRHKRANNNKSVNSQYEDSMQTAARPSLRNRDSLTSAETLLQSRQYPASGRPDKRTELRDSVSRKGKVKTSNKTPPSSPMKGSHSSPSLQKEKKSKQLSKGKDADVNISYKSRNQKKSPVAKRKPQSLHISDTKNVSKIAEVSQHTPVPNSTRNVINKSSEAPSSSSSKRGSLRDRTLLPTPESLQQSKQYPISFFYSGKKSASSVAEQPSIKGKNQKKPLKSQPSHNVSNASNSKRKKVGNDTADHAVPASEEQQHRGSGKTASPIPGAGRNNNKTLKNGVGTKQAKLKDSTSSKGKADSDSNSEHLTHAAPDLLQDLNKNMSRHLSASPNKSSTVKATGGKTVEKQTAGTNASAATTKLASKKISNKQYSLPRRPRKKAMVYESERRISSESGSPQLDPPQLSAKIVDRSWKQTSKVARRKPNAKAKPDAVAKKSNASVQKRDMAPPRLQPIDETFVGTQRAPRKRKLVAELEETENIIRDNTKNKQAKAQEVLLWCEEGQSRQGSDVTAYDVILQAVMDAEDQLSDTVGDALVSQKLVRRVIGKMKRSIKSVISDVTEVKELQHEVRKRKGRCNKLMMDIAEKQKKKAQLRSEIQAQVGGNKDMNMLSTSEWMKSYSLLMENLSCESG